MRRRHRLLALAAVLGLGAAGAGPATAAGQHVPFDARALIALSDVDTEAQAYIDDDIGPAIHARDTMTVIRPRQGATREVPVSNSVWGPPTTIDTTPDGRYAVALEVKRQRDADDQSFTEDLAFTTRISVVDLHRDQVVQVADTGGFAAHSLAISPRGDYVAVANWAEGQQISLMPLRGGRLGTPRLYGMADIPGPSVYPNTIAWHPSGDYLAVTVGPRNLVAFYRFTEAGLTPWGAPVEAGQFPFPGSWTPDGRFFIAATMEWNEPAVSDRNSPPGALSVVRFDRDPAGGVHHEFARGAEVGINPEGLAISPDGRHMVTVNMRYSHLPTEFDRLRPPTTSSLTLLTLDPATGATQVVEEYTFDGILPEGVVFDRTGGHLAVAVFDHNGTRSGKGAVQFWRVHRGAEPRLEQLPTEIPTVRGTHSLSAVY
jgi:DNA-binding beta-propeller fold protein YncE